MVAASFLKKDTGGSGATSAIGIAAPLPSVEIEDTPISLIAVTLA